MRSIYRDKILHFQSMNQDDGHLMLQHFDRFDHGLKMQFTTIYVEGYIHVHTFGQKRRWQSDTNPFGRAKICAHMNCSIAASHALCHCVLKIMAM